MWLEVWAGQCDVRWWEDITTMFCLVTRPSIGGRPPAKPFIWSLSISARYRSIMSSEEEEPHLSTKKDRYAPSPSSPVLQRSRVAERLRLMFAPSETLATPMTTSLSSGCWPADTTGRSRSQTRVRQWQCAVCLGSARCNITLRAGRVWPGLPGSPASSESAEARRSLSWRRGAACRRLPAPWPSSPRCRTSSLSQWRPCPRSPCPPWGCCSQWQRCLTSPSGLCPQYPAWSRPPSGHFPEEAPWRCPTEPQWQPPGLRPFESRPRPREPGRGSLSRPAPAPVQGSAPLQPLGRSPQFPPSPQCSSQAAGPRRPPGTQSRRLLGAASKPEVRWRPPRLGTMCWGARAPAAQWAAPRVWCPVWGVRCPASASPRQGPSHQPPSQPLCATQSWGKWYQSINYRIELYKASQVPKKYCAKDQLCARIYRVFEKDRILVKTMPCPTFKVQYRII